MEYYKILEINPGASDEQIKYAYKRLAIKYHPDKNKDPDAEEKFKKISEAYQYLSNTNNSNSFINSNNINSISPEQLFSQFFQMNIGNNNRSVNRSNFTNMDINLDLDRIFSGINSNNCISRETNIRFQDGKRIENIIETKNGVKTERTIITDFNTRLN